LISEDRVFLGALLAACSPFSFQSPFECINIFKKNKEGQKLLSGNRFEFKASLFLLFELVNCSAMSYVVVALVTIVTPHVGTLRILRRLAYATGKRFLIIHWSVAGPGPLVHLIFS
jgi:hypothetical protein